MAAAPTMLAVLVGILINNSRLNDTNTRIAELRIHMDTRFTDVDRRFDDVERRFDDRFDGVDRRFDEMRDLWRSV
jgi:flagellar capping protein FliD